MFRNFIMGVISAMLFGGCDSGPESPRFITHDSSGVEVVTSTQPLWEESGGWRISAEPLLIIGEESIQSEYQFHEIASAVRLGNGSVVVADGGFEQPLRIYHADGTLRAAVGRRGEGPEEFQGISSIQRIAPDTVIVVDRAQGTTTFLTPSGERVRNVHIERAEAGPLSRLRRTADGAWVAVTNSPVSAVSPLPAGIHRTQARLLVIQPGATVDTIGSFPGTEIAFTDIGNGRTIQGIVPYGRTFAFEVSDAGIYAGSGDDLSYALLAPDGTELRLIRAHGLDLTTTEQDLETFRAGMLAAAPNEQARVAIDQYVANAPAPATKAAYTRILVDQEGNVWLGPYESPVESIGPWNVFSSAGQYLGTLNLPKQFHVFDIGSDYILGRWRAENGVESLRMYALEKG